MVKEKKVFNFETNLSDHEKKLIKAAWFNDKKIYLLCLSKHITELTRHFAKKLAIPIEHVRVGTIEDLVKEVVHHNTKVIISIRDGKIIYDPLKLLHSLKINIQKGLMTGTKEGILRKFMLIKDSIKEIENIKTTIFSNIYIATIEACQTALILKHHFALTPRLIPKKLKIYLLGNGLEKKEISYANEIIYLYKLYEHKKINLPSGKKLDELSRNVTLFCEAVKRIK